MMALLLSFLFFINPIFLIFAREQKEEFSHLPSDSELLQAEGKVIEEVDKLKKRIIAGMGNIPSRKSDKNCSNNTP